MNIGRRSCKTKEQKDEDQANKEDEDWFKDEK